jgi:hypothetical protein
MALSNILRTLALSPSTQGCVYLFQFLKRLLVVT